MRSDDIATARKSTEPITELWLHGANSLAGIEELTSLETVGLVETQHLLDTQLVRLAELPELTTLQLGGDALLQLPPAITKLESLRKLKLIFTPRLDLADALPRLAKMRALDSLQLHLKASIARGQFQPSHELPDVFDKLVQIRDLELGQGLYPFPPSIGRMKKLESLSAGCNAFDSISPAIGRLENLRSLDLRSLPITALPDELCDCASLEVLFLFNCRQLVALPEDLGRLGNLRHLNIRDTKIRSLPASSANLAELRELIASPRSKLAVPAGFMADGADVLEGPPALLEQVAMRATETEGEDFVTIDDASRIPDSFGDPRHLVIDLPTFKGKLPQLAQLRALKTLKIRAVDLDAAFTALARVRSLRELEISGRCTALPDSLGGLTALTNLTLWTEGLKTLPTALGRLEDLEELIVGHGPKDLPPEIAKCTALRRLVFNGDTKLCKELAACTALEELHACAKAIAQLDVIAKLGSIVRLHLRLESDLDTSALFGAWKGRSLELIQLEGRLTRLPPEIGLVRVTRLDLGSSDLDTLPDELRECSSLTEIVLSGWRAASLKKFFPRGRWRKSDYNGKAHYSRSD